MKYLSSKFSAITVIIFITIGLSFLIYINIQGKFEYLLPPDLNIGGFFIIILILQLKLKTIRFDHDNLYYTTLFFKPYNEIPFKRVYNIVKAFRFNSLHPVYKILFYDVDNNLKEIYFVKSIYYLSEDPFEVLGITNPSDQFSKNNID